MDLTLIAKAIQKYKAERVIWGDITPPKYIPDFVVPTPKQAEFLRSTAPEVFYGGAARGGKTYALLMGALQYVHISGYSALLLRRTYRNLNAPTGLIALSKSWLSGTDARWNGTNYTWTFPSKSTLTFGHLEHPGDEYNYKGLRFQYIGFDELTEFWESGVSYVLTRLNRPDTREMDIVPLRARFTSNPGGVGHEWVKARFIKSTDQNRVFIPARLEDNPHERQAEYDERLKIAGQIEYARLRFGDWDVANQGTVFKREWFKLREGLPQEPGWTWIRAWDKAATAAEHGKDPDWTVGCLMGTKDAHFVVGDIKRFRNSAGVTEQIIKQTAILDGYNVKIKMEEEGGASGKESIYNYAKKLIGYNFEGIRATGSKATRAAPFAAAMNNGLVEVVNSNWTNEYINELCSFPEGSHDDQVDASSIAFNNLNSNIGYGIVIRDW